MQDYTVEFMRGISPSRTDNLLEAVRQAKAAIASSGDQIQDSMALTQESTVEPILDALGFTADRRTLSGPRQNTYELRAMGRVVALVITHHLDTRYDDTAGGLTYPQREARRLRRSSQFPGRIACTNGFEWSIDHPEYDIPTLTFNLDQVRAFWDLFILGTKDPPSPIP